jgi:hypothetical protein
MTTQPLRPSSRRSRPSWSGADLGKRVTRPKPPSSNTSTASITPAVGIQHWEGRAPWHSNAKWPKRAPGAARIRDKTNDIRLLLAASRASSLSEFAQKLVLDPTTASRRSKMLEMTLRLSLFQRGHGVLSLTDEGRHFLQHAQRMEEAELAFRSSARKLRDAPEGLVSISAPPTLARLVLAPGVAILHSPACSRDCCRHRN